ncbi:MAG: cobalamin B12-binding domain-containing protein, partial [Bacteroidota bacterium]
MRLLLTHAYFLHEDPKEKAIMRPYPPLGILYVAAYLEEQGFANQVFDTTFSSKEAFRAYLLEHRPQRIAFYVNLMTKLNVLESIRFIREEESLRSTTVILGGPDVRYNADHLLEYGADFLVVG